MAKPCYTHSINGAGRGPTILLKKRQQTGFSIIEMMMALSIMAILMAVAAVNLRGTRSRTDTRGAAELLASSLRQARQTAIAEERAVAIAIPTNNGTLSHGMGYYRLVGETKPQVRNRVEFRNEYGSVSIFGGRYSGPVWTTTLPANLSTDGFELSDWLSPYPQDFMLVFLPNGTVVSNLPLGDGAYRLVIAKSFTYSGTPANLSAADSPTTVSVTANGQVTLSPQIPLADAMAYQPGTSLDGAPVPAISNPANTPPALVDPFIEYDPKQNAQALAKIADVSSTITIPKNGIMTFSVHARDPDGDQLWCHWTGSGSFSCAQGSKMVWDEVRKLWVGQWSWRVPANALAGDTFTLTCRVYDNRGGVTTPTEVGLQQPKATVIASQSLLCAMRDGVYRWNWDGTNAVRILSKEDVGNTEITKARWSPDFSTIAFVAYKNLYLVSPEGHNLRTVLAGGTAIDAVCWARDGSTLYYLAGDRIYNIPATEGATATEIAGPLGLDRPTSLNMHPTAPLLVTSDRTSSELLTVWLPESSGGLKVERIDMLGDGAHNPTFSPDGSQVYFRCREHGTVPSLCYHKSPVTIDESIQKFEPDSNTKLLEDIGSGPPPVVSPDGQYIAGGMSVNGDRLSILPSNSISAADIVEVTPLLPTATRVVVDVDWGVY